jgi:putative ABC transport system permease protein
VSAESSAWLLVHFVGGYARARPWRALIQVAAIATGVALGYSVNLINASALDEFSTAERSLAGTADVSVVGSASGFDEQWYGRIAADPSVAFAAPLLEVEATLAGQSSATGSAGPPAALHIVGVDALRSAWLEPDLVGVPPPAASGAPGGSHLGEALLGDGLYASAAVLAQLHLAVGGTVTVVVGDHRVELPIIGTLAAAREPIASMDLGFAQWRLERLGRLSRIDVKFVPGVDALAVQRGWHLPDSMRVEHRQTAVDREQHGSRAYRVNLDVLAMVALFTGAFLVFSLQSQAIVVRRPQLALLRMLGAGRAAITRMLVAEAVAFGALGSLLGLAAGAALAAAALRTLGGDLGGGYFSGIRPQIVFDPLAAFAFGALGLVAAIGGAWLPAREAGAQAPAPALKAGVDPAPGSQRPRAGFALAAFALALALLLLPPVREVPAGAYVSIAVLLVATIALKPLLAPQLFGPLARWVSARVRSARLAPAWLASTRLARLPRFAAVGAAGIVASFALMVAMATMVDSFRSSFDAWLARVLSADLYVRAAPAGTTGQFSAADLERMGADPDVERAEFSRTVPLVLDPARPPVNLIARPLERAHAQSSLPLIGTEYSVAAADLPVWVSEPMAELYAAHPGAILELPLGERRVKVTVAGVWRDYARQGGSVAIDLADYERLSGDMARTDAALWLRPGASAAVVAQRLRSMLDAPAVQIAQPGQIRQISLHLFDRSFQVTYLIEWAAVAIGLLGLATTFSAQAVARTREFGMLRHLGVTRGQVLVLLAAEAALVTALAAALGLGAGLGIAWILVDVVNPQSFHWSMDLRVPYRLLAVLAAILLLAAAIASALAGRRTLAIDAVRAVKDDW